MPAEVTTYPELQGFIQQQARRADIDTATTAFPFLMEGAPASVTWHINVDRTDGEPVTRESFAPAMADTDVQNALHMHLVTRDRSSAGHIDDLLLGGGMTLRLPVLP